MDQDLITLFEFLLHHGIKNKDILCHVYCTKIILKPIRSVVQHDNELNGCHENVHMKLISNQWNSFEKTSFYKNLLCIVPIALFKILQSNYELYLNHDCMLIKLSAAERQTVFKGKSTTQLGIADLLCHQYYTNHSNKACVGKSIEKLLRLKGNKQFAHFCHHVMHDLSPEQALSESDVSLLVSILAAITKTVKRMNVLAIVPKHEGTVNCSSMKSLISASRTENKVICRFVSKLIIILLSMHDTFGCNKFRRIFIKELMKLIRCSLNFDSNFLMKMPEFLLVQAKLSVFTDRPKVIANFFYIVLTGVIFPILKQQFFICKEKMSLVYYQKPVWQQLQNLGFSQMSSYFTAVDDGHVQHSKFSKKLFGIYSIRIQPKANDDFRVIALLNKVVPCRILTKLPLNCQLIPTAAILKSIHQELHCQHIYPIKGKIDAGKKISVYKKNLEARNEGALPTVFYFLCDALRCYDNLDIDILSKKVLYWMKWEPFYHILKFKKFCHSTQHTRTKNIAIPSNKKEQLSFEEICESLQSTYKHCTLTLLKYTVYSKAFAQQNVRNFLHNSFITNNNLFYKRVRGIPQGAKVSKFLCDFYFCYIFKDILISSDSLFLSATDDFLLLSVVKWEVDSFMNDCIQSKYPFILNKDKTKFYDPCESKLKYYGLTIDTCSLTYE